MQELWCCRELQSLQNVKALSPALASDFVSWMEESHRGFEMSDLIGVFMVCVHTCHAVGEFSLVNVCLPRI